MPLPSLAFDMNRGVRGFEQIQVAGQLGEASATNPARRAIVGTEHEPPLIGEVAKFQIPTIVGRFHRNGQSRKTLDGCGVSVPVRIRMDGADDSSQSR